ncbi:hypothetical protein V5N11_021617 [Cardamine amara subsp. amara]|uniref:Retrotransposon gag domain-containing protein n=1 Tax=Cardamine amara subsp. amara TaxID=228776 RepID=A0ABD1A422_CARAN
MTSWDDFRERLLMRFGSGKGGSPYTRLMNLKQLGLVAEYRRQFEGITATTRGLPQEFLEEAFLNGLKPEIAEEVKLFCSSGLSWLKEMAQWIENKNVTVRSGKNYQPSLFSRPSPLGQSRFEVSWSKSNSTPTVKDNSKYTPYLVRKMSFKEIEEKKKTKDYVTDVTQNTIQVIDAKEKSCRLCLQMK